VGIASISYFLPQKFCPWSLETLTVYLPYPNVIIIYNLYKHSFVLRNLFVSAYWLDVWSHCIFCIFLFWFSAHAMLCLQLADGVWLSFIKRITYLLTYLLSTLQWCHPLPSLGHIWDVMLVWRKENITKTVSVLHSIVYYYNGAQRYEQFLQVGRLCRALIWLGLAHPSASVSSIFMVL